MLGKIRTGAAIALLLGASLAAHGAGLGRLSVNSALGQVLSAEIELLSLQPGEFESLSARVASPEAYREAKIEYGSALRLLRFSMEKRANGQPYIKVTSVAPVNEPFLDVLIEVTWPSGRLQREYPILLDPPGFSDSRPAARPPSAAAPSAPSAAPVAAAPAASAPSATTPAATGAPSARAEMPAKPAESGDGRKVEKGETLSKIAGEVKPATVSLEQMLTALYRENKSAFVDSNMNRLKAGQILRIPSAEEVGKISGQEATQEVKAHVANWKAYREGLAGGVAATPARSDSPAAATGRVGSAAVTPPPAPAAESKDVLKLSKTEGGKGAPGKAGGVLGGMDVLLEHDELVAAEAGDEILRPQHLAQAVRHRAEQLVAAGMAERVVDLLELVEVDEQQRGHVVAALGRQQAPDLVAEIDAVRQGGEFVVAGQVADPRLGVAPLGDVLEQHHGAAAFHRLERPRHEAAARGIGIGRDHVAGAGILDLGHDHPAARRRNRAGRDAGVDDVGDGGAALHEILGQVHHLAEAVVHHRQRSVGAEHAQPVRHVVERGVELAGQRRLALARHQGLHEYPVQVRRQLDQRDQEHRGDECHGDVIGRAAQRQRECGRAQR